MLLFDCLLSTYQWTQQKRVRDFFALSKMEDVFTKLVSGEESEGRTWSRGPLLTNMEWTPCAFRGTRVTGTLFEQAPTAAICHGSQYAIVFVERTLRPPQHLNQENLDLLLVSHACCAALKKKETQHWKQQVEKVIKHNRKKAGNRCGSTLSLTSHTFFLQCTWNKYCVCIQYIQLITLLKSTWGERNDRLFAHARTQNTTAPKTSRRLTPTFDIWAFSTFLIPIFRSFPSVEKVPSWGRKHRKHKIAYAFSLQGKAGVIGKHGTFRRALGAILELDWD